MTPQRVQVYQDDFSPGKGNALQAAVASIFGLSLDDLPNFIESPEGYEAAMRQFCSYSEGEGNSLNCVKVKLNGDDYGRIVVDSSYYGRLCILRGRSPRGNFGHVVVAKFTDGGKFEMIHDPHPEETFLDNDSEKPSWCMFFV